MCVSVCVCQSCVCVSVCVCFSVSMCVRDLCVFVCVRGACVGVVCVLKRVQIVNGWQDRGICSQIRFVPYRLERSTHIMNEIQIDIATRYRITRLTRSPTHSLAHPPTHSLTHSLAHSHTHTHTHSLTHSQTLTCTCRPTF